MELRTIVEIKAQSYHEMISTINTSLIVFGVIIASRDRNFLIGKLDTFAQELESNNLEIQLATQLDVKMPTSKAYIDVFIENLNDKLENDEDLTTSKHQMLYDFYSFIMYQITKISELKLLCCNLRNELRGKLSLRFEILFVHYCQLLLENSSHADNIDCITRTKTKAIEVLKTSMKKALNKLKSVEDRTYFGALKSHDGDSGDRNIYSSLTKPFFVGKIKAPSGL